MVSGSARRVWRIIGVVALAGLVFGAIAYFVGVPIAEVRIAEAWSNRPEIENWALPQLEAARVMLPIAVLVGVGCAVIAAVVTYIATRSTALPHP